MFTGINICGLAQVLLVIKVHELCLGDIYFCCLKMIAKFALNPLQTLMNLQYEPSEVLWDSDTRGSTRSG